MKRNILAIQMQSVLADRQANFLKVQNLLDKYCRNFKPDIIVLPEVWTTGWYCPSFKCLAESDNKTENFLSDTAKMYNASLIGGSYIKLCTNGSIKNVCPVFNQKGELIARYEKIHLYTPDGEAEYVQSGQTPIIVDIQGIKTGLSICYDIRFPELYRSYINSKNIPEFLVNISAWPLSRRAQYESMAKSRAIENQCYFLALSQTGEIKDGVFNAGNSLFISAMGDTIQKLDENEGALCVQINTNTIRTIRSEFPNLTNRKIYDFGFKPQYKKDGLYV